MRILVATDGSDSANRAVELAGKLAAQFKAELRIVHVIHVDTLPIDQIGDYALREHASLADVLTTFAEEKLADAKRRVEALGATNIQLASPFGDVALSVIDSARESKADMIVVGRRGRGQLSGLLLGSVSQKVVSVAPCPVVVVP